MTLAAAAAFTVRPGVAAAQSRSANDDDARALELFDLAAARFREGRFREAIELLDEASRLKPSAILHYNKARAFEGLEPSRDLGAPPKAPEPAQHGERRIVVRRAGGTLPLVMIAFRAPRATDPMAPALTALAVALAGTSGGDGASGRSSRLHRAIVEKGLATEAEASFRLTKDPHLFWIEAQLRPEITHDEVERALKVELDKVATELITEAELARVRRQLLAATAFGTDTITWRAYRCGELISTGAATSIAEWYEKIASVTREQIRDAAAATFTERTRNVGWFVPEAAD